MRVDTWTDFATQQNAVVGTERFDFKQVQEEQNDKEAVVAIGYNIAS